ncbi:bromodomain adjacent to zinc finger domain protein 1A-like isoform X2 [Physella acuta]|uniref:bromodomain adjacent to zinc finger domain protein 1A-like isoform X2 n=1 Tax=Physella acuta TaxID=109671 RepID=UPI0027DCFA67|nr:bromodomain adjacent to zinc finger domain protein 1A-like isoform X2 [Physella acuta]
MPLLRKQPFQRQKIPHDLDPEEEVFHCKITNEIFRDYNAFFERIILCNSLVWSCAITGRSGMTFQEAEECEQKAKRNLSTFQDSLKKPLLYLATLTHRSRLNDLNDDIFLFAKDRFFIGETLDYVGGSQRSPCKVTGVIPPKDVKQNGDIIVIDDSDDDSNSTSGPKSQKKKKGSGIDPAKYQYLIKLTETSKMETVSATTLCRKRGLYSRDRSKLFLKQHCGPIDGLWKVKESTFKKLNLGAATFEDFFAGPPPEFQVSSVKRKNNVKRSFDDNELDFEDSPTYSNKTLKNNKGQKVSNEPQVEYVPLPVPEDRGHIKEKMKQQKLDVKRKQIEEKEAKKEELKRQIEAEKVRRKEEKEKERMKKLEEKRRELEMYKEWSRPRDDLECDDLKEMPEFVPVRTRVPMELFGDAVMILEFSHIFKSIFDFKQFFPKGFTWGMIESAIVDHEPDGPLCDLLQMLLCALFNLQEEEADEYQELAKEKEENAKPNEDKDDDLDEELTTNEVIRSATIMAQFSQNTLGMPLRDTLLDQFTLSEIVRIHLLSSGAKASNKNARFRYQQRGGYTSHDDPGLELKLSDPGLVKSLATTNVFDLTPSEKVKIINTLIQQILTFAMVRDMIEENSEKLRLKKYDLKQLQWAEQRREKEEQANRYKKMMEEKAKEQARRMQQLVAEQSGTAPENAMNSSDFEEKSFEQKEAEKQKEHDMDMRKKAEFSKKEFEMLDEIVNLQKMVSISPIGRDRLFRRYYLFPSLSGLFIEDHELHVPACVLKPGAAGAGTKGENKENSKKSNGDDCIVISDAESDSSDVKEEDDSNRGNKSKNDTRMDTSEAPPVLESEDKPVPLQNPTWSFIDTPEHLAALIACLNTRGFRECALRTALMELKSLLESILKDCPSDMLCLPEDGGEEKARIQALAMTRGISSKKAAQDALILDKAETTMELNLRDAILDMEDRIHVGGLGTLKIKNRTAWRDAILNRGYQCQTDDPLFMPSGKPHINGGEDVSTETQDVECVARDLAKALVQIARGVEPRFMKDPLKEEETKRKKQSAQKDKKKKDEEDHSDEESSGSKSTRSLYERWEESLLSATSLSQVYLHLATLDKSIVWAKSTLETRCKLCRRKGDPEKMLLCDGCDRGHHMYCLKPPMEIVPVGDWFCSECRPKQAPRSPVRKGRRKTFLDSEEDEPSQNEEENEYADDTVTEQNDDDFEAEDDEDSQDSDDRLAEDDDDDDVDMELKDDPEEDVCVGCKTPGMLICCDCCPRAYHLHCAKPPLKKVPKGKWMCQVCMGIDRAGKIKIGSGGKGGKLKGKGKSTDKVKTKDRKSGSSTKSTPTVGRPRKDSPRNSPILGRPPKKNSLSSPVLGRPPKKHSLPLPDKQSPGETKPKRGRPKSRFSLDAADDPDPIIRLMKPIMPSSKRANGQQQQLRAAEELINELIKHEDSWPFLKPVDKKLVPDYYNVIKRPMDFGTIRNKIHAFTYKRPSEMLDDVRQIFNNCIEYNNRNSPEYKAYFRLSKHFDKRVRELSLHEDVETPGKNSKGRVSV